MVATPLRRAIWQSFAGIALVYTLSAWFSAPPPGSSTVFAMAQPGQASCQAGYAFNGQTCVDVNECQIDNGGCGGDSCVNHIGTLSCIPQDQSPICGPGTVYAEINGFGACVDINECALNNGGCSGGAEGPLVACTASANVNTRASCGDCPAGFNGDGTYCNDINECSVNNGGCSASPMVACTNTPGGSSCGACPSGYVGDGQTCVDINECKVNNGSCSTSPPVACVNTQGGSSCAPCPSGYTQSFVNGQQVCTDVNECLVPGRCPAGRVCENTPGSFACNVPPACPAGYTLSGGSCVDINECLTNNGGCSVNPPVACTNTPGGSTCGACPAGFRDVNGDGKVCVDIDECTEIANGGCSQLPFAACMNTSGSYACAPCPSGYLESRAADGAGNSLQICTNINECLEPGACFAGTTCHDSQGGYSCGPCPPGYAGDGITCTPVVETLVPSVFCVMPQPGDPAKMIALYAYSSMLVGPGGGAYAYPYDPITNALYINNVDQGAVSGVPHFFNPGTQANVFAVPFRPGVDEVRWQLQGPDTGTTHNATPGPTTPLCIVPPADGQPGQQGPKGDPGPQGPQGQMGPQGESGAKGNVGAQGPQGAKGAPGDRGPQGADGAQGPAGAQGPQGALGVPGDLGPRGATGPQGDPGPAGTPGAIGPAGPRGPTGALGPAGPAGAAGSAGPMGPMGPTGPQGALGAGLDFVTLTIDEDGTLVLPPGASSVMYLARMEEWSRRRGGRLDALQLDLVLPAAASSVNRFITVRRVDPGGQVIVRTNGEPLEGAAEIRAPRNSNAVRLANRYDYITFVTDGVKWYVFAQGQ